MNISLSPGLLLIFAAVICAVIAVIAVVFDVTNAKVYPVSLALALAFGFLGIGARPAYTGN